MRRIRGFVKLVALVRANRRLEARLRFCDSEIATAEENTRDLRRQLEESRVSESILKREVDLLCMIHAKDVERWKDLASVPGLISPREK